MASVLVSEAEKVYVLHGVQEDLRCDGRGRKDVRPIVVETDIGTLHILIRLQLFALNDSIILQKILIETLYPLFIIVTHASGSAHLRLANTDILVGVKGNIPNIILYYLFRSTLFNLVKCTLLDMFTIMIMIIYLYSRARGSIS